MCAAPNPCVEYQFDHPLCVLYDVLPQCICMPFKTGTYCDKDETGN